ncbi:protein kinase family protein [Actinomadura logoneensis]|uniref:phosphotransferase n=1 Tax=Actinomadura logoneensis TaxID=2293572 RepID=UPI001314B2C1|nr:phosphotransferase [Actinomadura logoneensis]
MLDAVEARTGPVVGVRPAVEGNHADIASAVIGPRGRLFLKAARRISAEVDGPEVRALRWEAAINPHVTEFAPRLLFRQDAGEWLALGYEYVDGRHADFAPGSPDLEILAVTIEALQARAAPDVLAAKQAGRRWETVMDDVAPLAGTALLHLDLNPANFLIGPGRVALVDWSFVARGAAWLELALVVPWLLKAGHSPGEADGWLSRFPAWKAADPRHLTGFAEAFAAKWRLNLENIAEPWAVRHADAARQWAEYRTR